MRSEQDLSQLMIGWQEWCSLPDLGIGAIKAKIDTGAKTSAIHAVNIEPFQKNRGLFVRFEVPPLQRQALLVPCEARVIDRRKVRNTGGQLETRFVIQTPILLGSHSWNIEITLANRDPLIFRMILGRDALAGHCIIDPSKILMLGRLSLAKVKSLY